MKKHFLTLSLIAVIAFTFNSCAPSAVVVRTRPVSPVYARPLSPGPSYVWVDGEWILRGNQYFYNQGYWATPRHRNSYWVSGHWKKARGGSYWVPGHWK
jgi:WXXGXW repeat (2 copies)